MQGEILIPITFFASIVLVVYLILRRKERAALIEKGQSATLFDTRKNVPSELKWGMLLVGIGIGILIGRFLALYTVMGEEESFFSMVFLCGGISLLAYHFVAKNLEKKKS
ncbi:MAG: hypothetical protein D4R67_04935 [Bacteroidetes bacterium]|nr:MAG: hypothetical protein D4R67_04935 [Bacteroidota bacterium]